MKKIKLQIVSIVSLLFFLAGCTNDGIDPITAVDPGPDEASPEITISYPQEGTTLKVLEEVTSIDIKFKVTDDIEIANIDVAVDGNSIAAMDNFTDYRIVSESVAFNNVTNGDHQLTVTATDIDGKVSTTTVNFSKEPPYVAKYDSEALYMPFDGDYTDLVNLRTADVVGSPSFSSNAQLGSASYQGNADSYLEYEIPESVNYGSNFSAAFWYKVNASPDRAGLLVAGDPSAGESRTQGFRLFREGSATEQQIKLNVGTGSGEVWNDGAKIDATAGEWVHIAFTVDDQQTVIYINGIAANTGNMGGNTIDWSGIEDVTIGSGGASFSYWGHAADQSNIDELRLFNKTLTETDVQNMIKDSFVTLHLPMDGSYEDLVSNRAINTVGNPGFAGMAKVGSDAYAGAEGSYLTFANDGLKSQEFSATFWYNAKTDAARAGILTVGPEDPNNPDAQNLRTSGFRLFREGNETEQRFKLNVGTGDSDSWNDGGVIDPSTSDWVHIAMTISTTETKIYINGALVNTGTLPAPISWADTDIVSVMSGAPRFTEWGHLADTSIMDNLRFYNKALSADEIAAMAN